VAGQYVRRAGVVFVAEGVIGCLEIFSTADYVGFPDSQSGILIEKEAGNQTTKARRTRIVQARQGRHLSHQVYDMLLRRVAALSYHAAVIGLTKRVTRR
jgi:hypothetical protein